MRTSEAQPILDAFGYLQHGLVTSAQAAASGIDTTTMTRLHQRDVIRRVRRGVYILAGVAEDSLTDIRAAWLATSPGVLAEDRLEESSPIVVSHTSAASILELGDITPAHHTFSSSRRKQSSAADIRHRVAPLSEDDITVINGLPVTTPLRTTADLAKDHLDGDQLHHVVASAIRDHRVKASQASARLAPYAGMYGYNSGEALVAEALQRFPEDDSVTEAARFSALAQLATKGMHTTLPWETQGLSELSSLWEKLQLENLGAASRIIEAMNAERLSRLSEVLNSDFSSRFTDVLNSNLSAQLLGELNVGRWPGVGTLPTTFQGDNQQGFPLNEVTPLGLPHHKDHTNESRDPDEHTDD